MSSIEKKQNKVSTDVALKDLTSFLQKYKAKEFRRGTMTTDKIADDYIDVVEAIEDGLLTFDSNQSPVYELRHPLYANAEDKSLIKSEVKFRSRIKEADKNLLLDGLDIKKQLGTYTLKYISYITQLSLTEVKELDNEDFEVLNQICSVF